MTIFSQRLRALRKERNESQADVTSGIGAAQISISQYENGAEPGHRKLIALANYFNVTTDYLLGLSDSRHSADDAEDWETFFRYGGQHLPDIAEQMLKLAQAMPKH